MVQMILQTIVIPQLQSIDKVVDVPRLRIMWRRHSCSHSCIVEKIVVILRVSAVPGHVVDMPVGVPTCGSSSTG